MRRMRGNMERRKWVTMAVDEAEDVVVPFAFMVFVNMPKWGVFCFLFLFFCFFYSFVFWGEKRREWKL